jgi:hypothetical protein
MATPASQLDQLIATTFQKVKGVLSDQITRNTALLAFLNSKSKVTEDGGLEIRRPLMYALNNTVKSYDGYDLLDTTPQGGFGYAVYNWRQFAGSLTIDGKTERINMGSAAIIKLMAAKMEQLRLSFEDALTTMLYSDGTGNSGKDLLGLQAIVTDSGTLGGVDSSTETWWKSKVVGAVSGAVGIDLTTDAGIKQMNNVYNSVSIAKSHVDLELTTQAVFEAYEALAEAHIRFTSTSMADLGFESIAHKRANLVFDAYAPAPAGSDGGFLYFLNSDRLEFVQHSAAWMKDLDFVRPANQDAKSALVVSMGNLITDNRRSHAVSKRTKVS